jgi:hypothetical protein
MASPRTLLKEIDLTTRVPSFPGAVGAITFAAKKGDIDNAVLVTSETDFLKKFTPDDTVEVGYSLGYYSALAFLAKSNKLWVKRVVGANYKHGTLLCPEGGQNTTIWRGAGEAAPASVAFAGSTAATGVLNDGTDDITITAKTGLGGNITVSLLDDSGVTGGNEIATFDYDTQTLTVLIDDGVSTQGEIATAILTDSRIATAVGDTPANAWTLGTTDSVTLTPGTGYGTDVTFALYGKDPGAWNDSIKIAIYPYHATETIAIAGLNSTTDEITVTQNWTTGEALILRSVADDEAANITNNALYYAINDSTVSGALKIKLALTQANALAGTAVDFTADNDNTFKIESFKQVPEVGAFIIEVFKSTDLVTPVETWTCSRTEGTKDGFGRNIYIQDVLEGSDYIRALDNVLKSTSVDITASPVPRAFNGGANGDAVTDGVMITGADAFLNPGDLFCTLLMDAGWATAAYHQKLITVAETRQDSVAILGVPYANEASSDYLNEVINYRKLTLNANTSYAALYTANVKIYDKFNDRALYVSPDGFVAANISETAANYEIWYPVGGARRGVLNVLDVRRRYSRGEMDQLYDNGINPIKFVPGKGIMIWGQKTLLSRPSALDRLNVRLLLVSIEPGLTEALDDFLFELNDVATRSLARAMISSYMDGIKARRGVTNFEVVCDSTNNSADDIDNHIMNVWLLIKPTPSLEYINFTLAITKTGVSFELAAQSLAA